MTQPPLSQCEHCGHFRYTHEAHNCSERGRKHHEVFMEVLHQSLSRGLEAIESMNITTPEAMVALCRKYADLAYPPPPAAKETP